MSEERQDERTCVVIGLAVELHRELGTGFLEAGYQEALAPEFTLWGAPFRREVELPVFYKGEELSTSYRSGFMCFDPVIVEMKAIVICVICGICGL